MKIVQSIKDRVETAYCQYKDFRTSRHIVVFESDDWGSIRMSDKKAWDELLSLGYAVDKRPFERYDTLESAEDLEALFNVLSKYKDCKGNHPIITANMLMANPDFEKIEKSGFQDYYFEPIAQTYKRYFGEDKVINLMYQGMNEGIFMPQCHGREHFNVAQWIRGLQKGDEDLLTAFRYGMCGIAPKSHPEQGNLLMKALFAETEEEQRKVDANVKESLQMFEQMWGFKSKSFIAPCYCWSESTEKTLADYGVGLIQASRKKKPAYCSRQKYYYTGKLNKNNQIYSVRNCIFDPATTSRETSLNELMKQIKSLFANHKIAIICTHRINYVSGLDERNRNHTLSLLDDFLKGLIEKYPDVEFLSSDKLINVIK